MKIAARLSASFKGLDEDEEEDRRVDFAQSHFGMQLNAVQRNTTLMVPVVFPAPRRPLRSALFRFASFCRFPPATTVPPSSISRALAPLRNPRGSYYRNTFVHPRYKRLNFWPETRLLATRTNLFC